MIRTVFHTLTDEELLNYAQMSEGRTVLETELAQRYEVALQMIDAFKREDEISVVRIEALQQKIEQMEA